MPVNLASPWSGLSLAFHFMCFLRGKCLFFWKIHIGCTDFVLILGVCNFFLKIHTGCTDFVAHVNARDTGRSLVSFYLWRGHAGTPSNLSYTLVVNSLLWEDNCRCLYDKVQIYLLVWFPTCLTRLARQFLISLLFSVYLQHTIAVSLPPFVCCWAFHKPQKLTSFYLSITCKL